MTSSRIPVNIALPKRDTIRSSNVSTSTVPASNFTVRNIPKDGNCFFTSIETVLRESGTDITPGSIRNQLAQYIRDNGTELANNASLQATLQKDSSLNSTPAAPTFRPADIARDIERDGHWNSASIDIAVALAGQTLGREIRILNPITNSDQEYQQQSTGIIPSYTDTLPGPNNRSHAGAPAPIYLLHVAGGTHFDLLELKATQPSTANRPKSTANSNQVKQATSTSDANLVKTTAAYTLFIERELLAGKVLAKASSKDLQNALTRLEKKFDDYDQAVVQVDLGKRKKTSTQSSDAVAQARNTKHEIEDQLSTHKRFSMKQRPGRKEALKAINLVGGRIAIELQQRNQQQIGGSSILKQQSGDLLERVTKKIRQPRCEHDSQRLEKDLSVLSAVNAPSGPATGRRVTWADSVVPDDHPVVKATERYSPFIDNDLLIGETLQTASQDQLKDGIKRFSELVDLYSTSTRKIDLENNKGSRLKNKSLLKNLQFTKQSIEDRLSGNTVKPAGTRQSDERQTALTDMHLIHSRLKLELKVRQDRVGNDPAISQESSELMAQLSKTLDDPDFSFSVDKLNSDIIKQLIPRKVGVGDEKLAIMQSYVDDVSDTLNMLSTEANTTGVGRKSWQSPEVDKIVEQVQPKLDKLKQSLKPTLNEVELAEAGIKANKILERSYSKIAKHAQTQLKRASKHSTAITDLNVLRDTSLLAAQHHRSSRHAGMFVKAEHEFQAGLPQHNTARVSSSLAPGPSINRSSTTRGVVGAMAGINIAKSSASNEHGEPINQLGASISGSLTGQHARSASLGRANNGHLLLKSVAENAGRVSVEASVGFNSKAFEEAVGQLPATAKINGSGNFSRRTGTAALTSSSEGGFRALHASKLGSGQAISGGGLGGLKALGIDDALGTSQLAGISQESIKLGHNNDHDIAAGFQALLGHGHTTAYDRSGKGPLTDMFTSMSFNAKPAAEGQSPKGVMSSLLSDPVWESKDVKSTTWKGNVFGQVNAPNRVLEHITGFFPINPGIKAGLSGSVSVENDSRTVRSPKLPHDMFDPALTLSSRSSSEHAREYFSNPSAANLTLSTPIAQAMGFDNTTDYFTAVAHSFGNDGPQIGTVNSGQLTQSYKTFESDVNLIDRFFIQPEKSLRESKLPELQNAIQRINQNYGAKLPRIDQSNIADFTATNRKGKTQSYQQFQDTAVAIMSGFSAAGGAMKLMASQGDQNSAQKTNLQDASTRLLSSIENRSMPWSKMEMVNQGAYVQQVVAEPLSRSVTTELTGELATFDGNNDINGHMEFDDGGINKSSYPGVGARVTRKTTTTKRDDNVIEPGQTGITRDRVTTSRKPDLIAQALVSPKDTYSPNGIIEKIKPTAKVFLGLKHDYQFNETASRTQAYTARPDETSTREFLAYKSNHSRSDYGVRATFGGAIPAGPVSVTLGASHSRDKRDYELKDYTYGNDVGAMSMIGDQLFVNHKININDVAMKIEESQHVGGSTFDFLDRLDDQFSNAILGNERYDHMSAIISKFRNAGIVETTVNGEKHLELPTLTENGNATPASSAASLHNSKGHDLDLTTDKKYVDRSGFFGYAVARYDETLLQDASKHWGNKHNTNFPDIAEIDGLLSKKISFSQQQPADKPTDQTRQQWLKSATKEERKDFYQNDTDGQKMLLNYLKVVSLSASINDVVFQNNTFQTVHDQNQIDRIDRLFTAPQQSKTVDDQGTFQTERIEI